MEFENTIGANSNYADVDRSRESNDRREGTGGCNPFVDLKPSSSFFFFALGNRALQ